MLLRQSLLSLLQVAYLVTSCILSLGKHVLEVTCCF